MVRRCRRVSSRIRRCRRVRTTVKRFRGVRTKGRKCGEVSARRKRRGVRFKGIGKEKETKGRRST